MNEQTSNSGFKIGALAQQTSSSVETIRYYEQQKLLPQPSRSDGNYRLYNESHVKRLQFIRHCRALDMTLDEIRTLLNFRDTPESNCEGVNVLLDHHIDHVAHRIKELKALQIQLKELRTRCTSVQSSTSECGILQGLSNANDSEPKNLGSHSGGCHSLSVFNPHNRQVVSQ